MKRILLASVACAALGAAAAQAAEPLKLSLGGMMKQQIAYADNQSYTHNDNVDEQGFGQINFKGSSKLDNGINIGIQVETLATQWNDSRSASGARAAGQGSRAYGNSAIRRAYMTVDSKFGQVVLGQREDYGYITGVSAPDVGWGLQGGDWNHFIVVPASHATMADTNNSRYSVRADKLSLVTPVLAGFSAGFSYTPDIRQSWTGDLTQATGYDGISTSGSASAYTMTNANGYINRADFGGDTYLVGLSYNNALGPVGIKGNLDFSQYNIGNMRTYQGGLQATYAGFTVGGSIFARDVPGDAHVTLNPGTTVYSNSVSQAILHTGLVWDAGIGYAVGPCAVTLGYFHDSSKRDGTLDSFGGAADSTQVYALSGKYTMGPGVEWRNAVYYVDYKNNNATFASNDTNNARTNNSGVALITGLQVTF